jgi:transposase
MKTYVLKESLDQLWTYTYEGAALRHLIGWAGQLRWQRLRPFNKLADMLFRHLEGHLNYCRIKVPFGVVEAVNGNIKALLRRALPGFSAFWPEWQRSGAASAARHSGA